MDARYDAAFQQFVADGATSQRAADAMTREINRAPFALIDKIVARVNLQGSAASEVADLRREVYQVAAALAGLLVVLCIASVMVSRSVTTPLRETVRGLEHVAGGADGHGDAWDAGTELAERLQAMTPDVWVLLVSGYTDEVIATSGLDERGWTLMQKPFTPQDLARQVRQILSRKREARN